MNNSPVGIVTGLQFEARIARKALGRGVGAPRIACHGMGPKRAREAATELVKQGVSGLVSFGLAGGLTAQADPGLVLLPTVVHAGEGGEIACDAMWRERLRGRLRGVVRLAEEPLASVKRPLPLYIDKVSAWAKTQGLAADMESAAIAAVALRAGIPFVALRAVADPVDFSLPEAAVLSMGKDGRLKPWRLAASLWRRPAQLGALRELARHAAAAKTSLVRAARAAGPDFALAENAGKKPENRNKMAH